MKRTTNGRLRLCAKKRNRMQKLAPFTLEDALVARPTILKEVNRSSQTAARYSGVIHDFLARYDRQEQRLLAPDNLTPTTLANYRSYLPTAREMAVQWSQAQEGERYTPPWASQRRRKSRPS